MAIMKHPVPARPELGSRDGLAYALFVPEEPPTAGVVICHGAGSAKESHFDFARAGCFVCSRMTLKRLPGVILEPITCSLVRLPV